MPINTEILRAIANKNLLEVHYKGLRTVVEPHCFGIGRDGQETLIAFPLKEMEKALTPFSVPDLSEIRVLEDAFPHPRDEYQRNHGDMLLIYNQL